MKYLFWLTVGLCSIWISLIVNAYFPFFGIKINFIFIGMLLLLLRWADPFLLFLGSFLGLVQDALSHSMLGVYGLSFFLSFLIAKRVGESLYGSNFFSTPVFVFLFSCLEGSLSFFIFKLLSPQITWNMLFFQPILGIALVQAMISPLILWALQKGELSFRLTLKAENINQFGNY